MLPLLDELRRFPSSIDSPFLTHTLSRITRDERVLRYATRATSVPAAEFFPAVAAGIREWPAASGGDESPAAWTRLAEDTAALYAVALASRQDPAAPQPAAVYHQHMQRLDGVLFYLMSLAYPAPSDAFCSWLPPAPPAALAACQRAIDVLWAAEVQLPPDVWPRPQAALDEDVLMDADLGLIQVVRPHVRACLVHAAAAAPGGAAWLLHRVDDVVLSPAGPASTCLPPGLKELSTIAQCIQPVHRALVSALGCASLLARLVAAVMAAVVGVDWSAVLALVLLVAQSPTSTMPATTATEDDHAMDCAATAQPVSLSATVSPAGLLQRALDACAERGRAALCRADAPTLHSA